MAIAAAVILVLLIAAAVGAWWWWQERAAGTGEGLADLIERAEALPPSPTRTVVRLRVELRESVDAAAAAAEAVGPGPIDLATTVRRLQGASEELDADLANMTARGDGALGPVIGVLRGRVRELQSVADRVVVLSRDAAADATRADLQTLHEALDHELNVLDAHRELGGP
ncbi:MAG: hypothetical protein AAGA99_24320 [Actinomycetota bacterium]